VSGIIVLYAHFNWNSTKFVESTGTPNPEKDKKNKSFTELNIITFSFKKTTCKSINSVF
jgi:hypothetical protein